MSFQLLLLVEHFTNWTGHNLLTGNILTDVWWPVTQDVLVRCSVIMFDHNAKLTGHLQNLVVQCPVTDYFQHCNDYKISAETSLLLLFFSSRVKSRRFFGREFYFGSQWGLAFDVTMTTKGTILTNHNAKKLLETGVKRGKTRRANHNSYCFSLWLAEKVAWNFLCQSPIVTVRKSRDSEELLETVEKSCSIVYLFIFFGFFTASVQRCGSHQSNEKPSARFWINEIVGVEQQWKFILTSWPGNESELLQI